MESNMPRKKPEANRDAERVTAADCIDVAKDIVGPLLDKLQDEALAPVVAALQAMVPTLKYSPEDMVKLDEFAVGLLGDTSRNTPSDGILESRIRMAYLRAEVMLTIRKEIAALEA